LRASLSDLLAEAAERQAAVGAFTCYNLETVTGALEAAESAACGVVLLISPGALAARGGALLLAAVVAAVDRSSARACVQLDHAANLDLIGAALQAGAGAVMADGSRLGFEENIAFVRRAVELARPYGAQVEAELGRVEGEEDVAVAAAAGAFTDPGQAHRLVQVSDAVCLAVSIGNVHGTYASEPRLDFERMDAIRAVVSAPLALHGASGLPEQMVREAIAHGARKVNVNTELRQSYLAVTAEHLLDVSDGANVMALNRAQADAVAKTVAEKLAIFAG